MRTTIETWHRRSSVWVLGLGCRRLPTLVVFEQNNIDPR
jgi:hypothetical protein